MKVSVFHSLVFGILGLASFTSISTSAFAISESELMESEDAGDETPPLPPHKICIADLNFQQEMCLAIRDLSALIRCGPIGVERDRLAQIAEDVCARDPRSTACRDAIANVRSADLAGAACTDQINKETNACWQAAATAYDRCLACVRKTGKLCPVPIYIEFDITKVF